MEILIILGLLAIALSVGIVNHKYNTINMRKSFDELEVGDMLTSKSDNRKVPVMAVFSKYAVAIGVTYGLSMDDQTGLSFKTKKDLLEYFNLPEKQFEPRSGDTYYFVTKNSGKFVVSTRDWEGNTTDKNNLADKNVFQTSADAKAKLDKIVSALSS